jgi:tetratricopeptide (TPR) repeat protein
VFDDETGARYLLSRTGRDDGNAARDLSRALGRLPLALAHAGAYCRAGTSFADYRALLIGLPVRELFEHDPEAAYADTVASTWQVSIAAARERASLAAGILEVAAYLAPDAIPIVLFEALLDGPADVRERKRLHDGLRALHRFSLVEVRDGFVYVHRLLQKVIRDDAEARTEDAGLTAALRVLDDALPGDSALPTWWPQYEALLPHITAIADTAAVERYPDQTLRLLNRASVFLLHADAGQRLLSIALSAARLADQRLPMNDPQRLTSQANLGSACWSTGRTGQAIELQEQVLAGREQLLGAEHPDTLTARADLAVSYWSAGRLGAAIELEERVLADSERLLGIKHPDTLTARGNLASSYRSAGRTDDAIHLGERVLADSERLLGAEHPDTLTARGSLASFYWSAGRTDEAVDLQQRVLADSEQLLGTEHPDTLMARANLASSYRSAGRTDEAIDLLERVLADRERLLGPEHPGTLTARANLAASYRSAERTEEAIDLGARVVVESERLLGPEHPRTLTARANLAASYRSAGRTEEAILLGKRALADSQRLLGPEHPQTHSIRAALAEWHDELPQRS